MIQENKPTDQFMAVIEKALKGRDTSDSSWLKAHKQASFERFKTAGIPTTKDEEWKYTNITQITKIPLKITDGGKLVETKEFERFTKGDETLLVFINGAYAPDHSRIRTDQVTVLTLKDALKKQPKEIEQLIGKYKVENETSFVALSNALTDDGCFIKIDKNTISKKLIHICHVTSASNGEALILPRTIISVGKSAQASVLESHVAFSDKITYFANALTDIFLEENATLHYTKAQKESLKAYHIGNTRVWQERNSNFNGFSYMSGAALTRNNLDVIINGEGANANLNGLYSVFGDMHVDNHTSIDHRTPNCNSNQLYKGVLNEQSRAVFNGKIYVKPIAQKTNSYQLNKNLLLGDGCRVDTKPQLEIFADDVKCTHGATIGQLSEDELFYLQARSIPRQEAMRILAKGFIDDLIHSLEDEAVIHKLHILLEPSFARF